MNLSFRGNDAGEHRNWIPAFAGMTSKKQSAKL